MKSKIQSKILISCSSEIKDVPSEIELLPLGLVHSRKGSFVVDEESYRLMKDYFLKRGVDVVVDYEHQTLTNAQAPAAGWIKDLVLTDHSINAVVEWNPKAQEYLKNREYRYCSPVLDARYGDKKAIRLHSVALTNSPAIDGMYSIVNSLDFNEQEDEGDDNMDILKEIAKLLGLSENATEEQILEAIKTLANLKESSKEQDELVVNKTIGALLEVDENAKTEVVAAKIMALKNPAGFVPVDKYNEVTQKLQKMQGDDLVEMALKDGKITPAQKDWAKEYVLKDQVGFKKFMEIAQPSVPMDKLDIPIKSDKNDLESTTLLVCKNLGLSAEDLKTYGKDEK